MKSTLKTILTASLASALLLGLSLPAHAVGSFISPRGGITAGTPQRGETVSEPEPEPVSEPKVTRKAVVFSDIPLITPRETNNINRQNYPGNWAATVKSYLFENEQGGLTRVEYIPYGDDPIVVENYSASFVPQSFVAIPMELTTWGGFYAGTNYNFFVFGQNNPDEDDGREVIRVVKYSKSWQRLGQASLKGANTIVPFEGGSVRFAEEDGMLYIRTSHQMYASSDGKNHQANLTLAIREQDMTITDSGYLVTWGIGYVSHSFNQFVLIDREKNLVTLDHGDAYPRSLILKRFDEVTAGGEKFSGDTTDREILTFPGATGDNYTGAGVGGFAETANGYVTAYNYDGTVKGGQKSVYLAHTAKNGLKTTLNRLTSDVDASTPVLASTGESGGYILWNEKNSGSSYYATYGKTLSWAQYYSDGSVSRAQSAKAALSDCQPILWHGKMLWYVTENSTPVFYTLDDRGIEEIILNPFLDLRRDAYYYDAVLWAYKNKITSGTTDTTFSPGDTCTRAQVVTFLWRAMGEPKPENYYNPYGNPFVDMSWSDYYYSAVLWAVEQGITTGTDATHFSPDQTCTRAHALTFLSRCLGNPVGGADWAEQAENWARSYGLLAGLDSGYTVGDNCPRSETVYYLWKALERN